MDVEDEELDPDLLMDMPVQGGSGLEELDFAHNEEGDSHAHFGGQHLDQQLSDLDEQDLESPRARRRTAGHFLHRSSRQSLAFELASALQPSTNSASLLAELGIDEEADGDAIEQWSASASGFAAEGAVAFLQTVDPPRSPPSDKQIPVSPTSSRRQNSRRVNGKVSLITLRAPSEEASAHHATLQNSEEPKDNDAAAAIAFSTANAALEASLRGTNRFIASLQTLGATSGPSETVPPVCGLGDRQPVLEKLASALIKTLYELVKRREEQIKELKEIERVISEADPSWQSALAEVDPIPPFHNFSDALPLSRGRLHPMQEEEEEEEYHQDHQTAAASLPVASMHSGLANSPFAVSVSADLAGLRNVTDSLGASLAAMVEQAQVGKATNTNVSRKLKSLYGALGNLASEAEAVERSHSLIKVWEEREMGKGADTNLRTSALPGLSTPRRRKTSSSSGKSTASQSRLLSGRYSEQVRAEMKEASALLESCHNRARTLLATS